MSYGDVFADRNRVADAFVDDGVVLDIGAAADLYFFHVGAKHGPEEDGDVIAEGHVAFEGRIGRDIGVFSDRTAEVHNANIIVCGKL